MAAWGAYVAEVLDVKENHGACFAVVRGGTHHFRLPASWGHSHPFTVIPVEEWRYPFARPGVRAGPSPWPASCAHRRTSWPAT